MNQSPGDPLMAEAMALFGKGDFKGAMDKADQLIAKHPDVALSWRFKGECLFQMARYLQAVKAFNKAMELGGPGTEELVMWKALAQQNDGRTDEAKATLRLFIRDATPEQAGLVQKAKQILGKLSELR